MAKHKRKTKKAVNCTTKRKSSTKRKKRSTKKKSWFDKLLDFQREGSSLAPFVTFIQKPKIYVASQQFENMIFANS